MPAVDEMFTIEPPPLSRMAGAAVLIPRNGPTRLIDNTFMKCSTLESTSGVNERDLGAVDLVLSRLATDLHCRFGEPQRAGRADRVRREHAAAHVHGQVALHAGDTVLDHAPAFAGIGEAEVLEPHGLEPRE